MKTKRTVKDKLHTLFFGKDLRVTEGEPYTEVREGDYSAYYPLERYIDFLQKSEGEVFDVRSFGADVSKSEKENTAAIQSAVDECSKRGGTVLVAGGCYTVTTVFLYSDVTLFIEKGSAICANTTGKGYMHNALIYACDCENICITGGGRLIGRGTFFGLRPVSENMLAPAPVIDVIRMRRDYRAQLRFAHRSKYGSILLTERCRNIKIHNIIFEDSPWWTYKMLMCDGVKITDSVIFNNRNVANSDGFDIAGSSNVEIDHCFISTADDGIVLKNAIWCGCEKEMSGISVRNCEVISRTNCFKIGTETTYDIHGVTVENCSFLMTDLYPGAVSGVSIETCDGARVYDIKIRGITMDRCTCPLFIRLCNRNRAAEVTSSTANKTEIVKADDNSKPADKSTFDGKSELYDVTVEDITAKDAELPVIVAGYKQKGRIKRCRNITLRNIDITYRDAVDIKDKRLFIPEYAREYPECWRFRNLPAYGVWARHCENLKVENFSCKGTRGTHRKEKIFIDCR
ncbi:MAG: hypothetical protein IKJ27_11870 [Clostridia bacterium]|nr:hypothetical protein [Clostridia bacterium]